MVKKSLSLSFPFTLSLLSIFLLFLTIFPYMTEPSSTTNLDLCYGRCRPQRHPTNPSYESNLQSLLTLLASSATNSSYNNFTVLGSTKHDYIYGLYQCRGDLTVPDCASCVASAVMHVGIMCQQSCGGSVQLDGYYVRYDNTTFFGCEDKTVVVRNCGPSVGYAYSPDVMRTLLRDGVLAGLVGSGGPFRVVGSGNMTGVAQCTGDLTLGECQDCVSEAVSRLKTDCAVAADYGDMFLRKCYARYSINGAHGKANGLFLSLQLLLLRLLGFMF